MSRSLIQRITPFFAARIRQNHRFLTSNSSSSVLHEASPSSSPDDDAVHINPIASESYANWVNVNSMFFWKNMKRRMKELQTGESASAEKMLRLSAESGGCAGFRYVFNLDGETGQNDRVFERDGVKLVVDNVSYDLVKGAY